jgi:hypothetical protein
MDEGIKRRGGTGVKNWSNDELVDLIKKQLETDLNLDFLLELRTNQLKQLAVCIREKIEKVQRYSSYCKQVFPV